MADPAFAALCVVLSYAWAIAAPVAAWLALCEADRVRLNRREHPQLTREAILAAVAAPFYVLSGVVVGWVHLRGLHDVLWYMVLAGVAAARWLAPPALLAREERWQRLHRVSAMLLVVFGVAHVGNHLAALDSLQAHVTVQNMLRAVYRQPAIEVLIVIAALVQVGSGWLIVSRARLQRANGLRNLQVLAGAFLGMFFLSHLTGVFSGRLLQNVDTTFAWATSGSGGVLTKSPAFLPYYSLAVLAFLVHAALAARWTFSGVLGQTRALKLCYGLLALSGAVTIALLLPLCGVRLG
ncbi:MAG TPA: hypothetical protein VKT49_04205 [Bryobacteraceae bacterium]|nr:hypothetical protein [Bryobacteraceae bacterium]